MARFALCDDEREMAELFAEKLREFYPEECEISCYTNGVNLLEDCVRELFDAFFLDVEMREIDGFSLAEKIRAGNPFAKIIFVTNNTERARVGYLYGAFRYVWKFAIDEELREAAMSLKREFDLLNEVLLLKTPCEEILINVNNIRYFEVEGHHVTAFFDDNEERVSGTLNEYEERLKSNGFIRIHKSFLVNFRFIRAIGTNSVSLMNGETLPLSRNRVAETKKNLMMFLRYSTKSHLEFCRNR